MCKAFSNSNGYFFLGATSLIDSSNPDITVGRPLYPAIPASKLPKNVFAAAVVCKPLQPMNYNNFEIPFSKINYYYNLLPPRRLTDSGEDITDGDLIAAATAASNLVLLLGLPRP